MDITKMTTRELVRGLMRGNRAELKLGYSPANTVLAVLGIRPDENKDELRGYSQGFFDGMQRGDRMWIDADADTIEHRAYDEGFTAGLDEPAELVYIASDPT